MAERKLVEISPSQHRSLDALRNLRKKKGLPVPSMPALVQRCVELSIEQVLNEYWPDRKANERQA